MPLQEGQPNEDAMRVENERKSFAQLVHLLELNRKWCCEHLEILQAFGRYPHRNKVLGRENTEEEELYLRDAGSFGSG